MADPWRDDAGLAILNSESRFGDSQKSACDVRCIYKTWSKTTRVLVSGSGLLFENGFWQHSVDTFGIVNQLAHVEIDGE